MSFTYNGCDGTNDQIDLVRVMIPDTDSTQPIFQDNEILAFYRIQAMTYQSSMFYSGSAGRTLPTQYVSILRVVALALDTIANNAAQLGIVSKLLDVTLRDASAQLAARANQYRTTDDESGAFAIIEQCPTVWATRDRFFKQVQRMTGGGGL